MNWSQLQSAISLTFRNSDYCMTSQSGSLHFKMHRICLLTADNSLQENAPGVQEASRGEEGEEEVVEGGGHQDHRLERLQCGQCQQEAEHCCEKPI